MADGQHRKLADLEVGDAIYGTVQRGQYQRYVHTTVLAKWTSMRSAYGVTLENGTELITSGDHRFLTSRGWKHVIGAEQGPLQRPHLTTGVDGGTGSFVPAGCDADYRRGYLCGLIRGDGHLGSYCYPRPGRTIDEVHRFRLAFADVEALRRASGISTFGVSTTEFQFAAAATRRREMMAIRTQARTPVERVRELIEWPWLPAFPGSRDSWPASSTLRVHARSTRSESPTRMNRYLPGSRHASAAFTSTTSSSQEDCQTGLPTYAFAVGCPNACDSS